MAEDRILYLEEPKSFRRQPELINVAEEQVTKSMYENQYLSYTPIMNLLRNQENNPFHNSLKNKLGINLTEEVKDIYNENYKTLKK